MKYKYGKLPARPGAVKLKMANYTQALPKPPKKAGHFYPDINWGVLGNDQFGDCAWAGAAHETTQWNREASITVSFTTANVLSDYADCTGFDILKPSTDQGTDMQKAADYRLNIGITDGQTRHKIGAYTAITPGNIEEIKQAIYLFGVCAIGIQCPDTMQDQFAAGKPWTVVRGASIEGGHYVPAVGYDSKYVYLVTWGKLIKASWGFIRKYMDEGIAYLSQEYLKDGKSLEGFDLDQLKTDLAKITG